MEGGAVGHNFTVWETTARQLAKECWINDTVNKKINCLGADILKLLTSYRGERFQVPTRLTTVTRQRPHIILPRSISRLNEILFHYQ
jgi:hypothetical protein